MIKNEIHNNYFIVEINYNAQAEDCTSNEHRLYPEINLQQNTETTPAPPKEGKRTPNLNPTIVNKIAQKLGLTFVPEKENGNLCFANNNSELRDEFKQVFAHINILDYIYAVLHSPTYREKYKEFLKIDFPRVPYPTNTTTFWQLVNWGTQLRQIHLLESPIVENYLTQYPINGDNKVTKIRFDISPPVEELGVVGKVHINNTQYFNNVPQIAWEFFIGGYQPAQKWLKDRKKITLEFDDILHYQKIIVALTATHNIIQKINAINIEA